MEVIYTVCSSSEEAKLIGKILVQEKLCACVNIFPAMESIYFWEGNIVEDEEAVLLIKTHKDLFDKISKDLKKENTIIENDGTIVIQTKDREESSCYSAYCG